MQTRKSIAGVGPTLAEVAAAEKAAAAAAVAYHTPKKGGHGRQ